MDLINGFDKWLRPGVPGFQSGSANRVESGSRVATKTTIKATIQLSSQFRHLLSTVLQYLSCTLNEVPQQGEQCPVENNSYKGYSPPNCTCNAISHIQVKTYTFLLKCLHAMDENVTHPIPCPESSRLPHTCICQV